MFDVYIQEKLVWKDFDIVKEAPGVDKVVIKVTKAVQVTNKTLEIRFHWSGKGTTASPSRGIYGPLISAISIEPGFGCCSFANTYTSHFTKFIQRRDWFPSYC